MKKTTITFFVAWLLMITGLHAQTIQEGVNHLYAKRNNSAVDVFQKLLATNPNNIDAIFWLGQAYFNKDDNEAARQLYQKAIATNGSVPLLLVGLGHADLLDKKNNEARQRFEEALTVSRTRKGDDPIIQTAIGRAIVDSKTGDFKYAIQLLLAATAKDPKNTETLLQLGNAYRKADPGKGGSDAYIYYNRALDVNSKFAAASVRLAKLFESQQNWIFVLKYLNEAVEKDPKFSDAYYELYWYYFLRREYPEADNQLQKYIASKLPDTDILDEYLYGQLCWVKKDFDCAIARANKVVDEMGAKTKPRVYKLLAYSYFDKGDYPNANKSANDYFAREKPEDFIKEDYKLKADILSKTGGTADEIYNTYIQGAALDSVLSSKIDFLKQGVDAFKENKNWDKTAMLIQRVIDLKPNPTINDYFDLMHTFYKQEKYSRSRDVALLIRDKYPDQVFGYDWAFINSVTIDTVKLDSIAVPDALMLFDFAQKDSVKFRGQYINSARFLGGYYINAAKDKEMSLLYFQRWQNIDTANAAAIQSYIDQIKKMPANPGTKQPATSPARGSTPNKTNNQKPLAAKPGAAINKSIAKR